MDVPKCGPDDDFDSYPIRKKIILHLFRCSMLPQEEIIDEILLKIKNDFPEDVIRKALTEHHLYYDQIAMRYRILSVFESQPESTKLTLIHYLVIIGQIKMMKFFIENYKPDLEIRIKSYCVINNDDNLIFDVSLLWLASFTNNAKMVHLLLSNGANPNIIHNHEASALRLAVWDQNMEIIEMLLDFNADPNQVNIFNNTSLMLASYKGYQNIVKLLLKHGTDPNKAAYCGNTALHFAAEECHTEIVTQLLDFGAKFQRNISGLTPLFSAAFNHQMPIIDLFFTSTNFVTLQDQITTFELLGIGVCMKKTYDEITELSYRYFRNAFILRYIDQSLDWIPNRINMENIIFDPKKTPIHYKSPLPKRPEYGNINETETLEELELISTDTKRLLYECLFISERIFGENSLKLAEVLTMVGSRLIDQFKEYKECFILWKKAIEIKINSKVFISKDMYRFMQALFEYTNPLRHQPFNDCFQWWIDIINFAIKYFEARPVPNELQAFSFKVNIHDIYQIERFTLNDVKVENIISQYDDCFHSDEGNDIDHIIEIVLMIIFIFTKQYYLLNPSEKEQVESIIGKFLKLNFTYTRCGRNIIHMIFLKPLLKMGLEKEIKSMLSMLYRCGVNTNVYDTAYNSPLHYLAFYGRKNDNSLRILANLFKDLVSHVYHGRYIRNALYHFDYGDTSQVHLDAVNIFNQTAFDINPGLIFCSPYPNLNLFPLKCLAARVAHSLFLRCNICRYLSMYRYNDRMQYNLAIRMNEIKKMDDSNVYEEMINLKDHYIELKNIMNYSLKYKYADHVPKIYNAKKIWKLIEDYSKLLRISVKLLEFIEMHGPCKFVHHLEK